MPCLVDRPTHKSLFQVLKNTLQQESYPSSAPYIHSFWEICKNVYQISTYAILCFIFSLHGGFPTVAKSTSIICSCAVVPTAVAWCWIVCCAPRVAGIKLESVIVHIMLKTEHSRLPHSQVSICIIIALSYFQSQVS